MGACATVLLAAALASSEVVAPAPAKSLRAETSAPGPAVEPGRTVRLFSPVAADWRTGTLLATRGSQWQVRVRGGEPVWVDVRDYSELQVLRRTGLPVPAGFGLGLLVGVVVAGAYGDCWNGQSCSTANALMGTGIYGGVGATLALLTQRERWVPLAQGVGVSVRPIADRSGRGVGAALRVSF